MCHAYSITTTFDAIRQWVGEVVRAENIGNLAPQTGVYPDLMAPIVRNQPGYREFVKVRWGMPTSSQALYQAAKKRAQSLIDKGRPLDHDEFLELVRLEPDRGTHNVRNTNSSHWLRWLAPEFRCVVPFTSFAEFDNSVGADGRKKGNTWFAYDLMRPLGFFAGIVAPQWTSVRKVGEGMITTDLFAFLTTDANGDVAPVNPDSMPVILTTPDEIEIWMTAPWEEARKLQRPLPAGSLKVVSVGNKEDPPEPIEEPSLF
jgi:putative SOS response-associated peptidase YedK